MYADMELLFPYIQKSSQEAQPFADLFQSHMSNASMIRLIEMSPISEYDLGGEGDLFKAPEPIIQESIAYLDPMTAPISMISCGEEVIPPQALKVSASIQSDQLLSEVFYDCQKDLLEKSAIEAPVFKILDSNITMTSSDEKHMTNFFTGMDFEMVYGMRRAFSEGDIKDLGNGHISPSHSPRERNSCSNEERMQKLSRYWDKKKKRNFGRKIKYACRKALADSQPRVRGRFARTEAPDLPKKI